MWVFGVGGCSSGVGKTTLICRLLEGLSGWGALKTTPVHKQPCPDPETCAACHGLRGTHEIVTDPGRLFRAGSDTERYRSAGAARVAWLKSRPDLLGVGIDEAVAGFRGLPGVIVEGNSFTRHLEPDRMILVARASLDEIKPSARRLVDTADLVVLNDVAGVDGARVERWRGRLAAARDRLELEAADPGDAGTRALLERVRSWAGAE